MMLADKATAWVIFESKPADPTKVKVSEWDAATNIACNLLADGSYLGPAASSEVSETLLCGGTVTGFGADNYQGQATVARFYDTDGKPDQVGDATFTAMQEKGTTLFIGVRRGPKWDAKGATGQQVSVFEVMTDLPQDPQQASGYIKNIIGLGVQNAWLHNALVTP